MASVATAAAMKNYLCNGDSQVNSAKISWHLSLQGIRHLFKRTLIGSPVTDLGMLRLQLLSMYPENQVILFQLKSHSCGA